MEFLQKLWQKILLCADASPWSNFFLNEDISPFCGAADIPVLDLQWHLPWVSNPWLILLHASALSPVCNRFLRFTSGATPADFLVASMAAEPFWYTYWCTSIGSAESRIERATASQHVTRQALYRLSWVCSAFLRVILDSRRMKVKISIFGDILYERFNT